MLANSKRFQPNELHPELLSVVAMSPFEPSNSASRSQMFSSHLAQALVVQGSTERYVQTGMEREYGKYTFSVSMPCDAEIIRVLERYPRTIDGNSIAHNPETLVVYEDVETKEVGCLSLVDYFSHHQYFGFAYKRKPALNKLRTGEYIAKGTILLDSPSITDTGGYKYGRECNVAFMSHPAVSEDGIVANADVLKEFSFKTYETRIVEWGSKHYPLNLYGDENHYKPHPDIGDFIRDDDVLMALRSYDESFSPVEQSTSKTMKIDHIFDSCTYAGGSGGRVIDIRVMHDSESSVPSTPVGMEVQTERYDEARRRYYQEIYNVYTRLRRTRGVKLQLSHDFQRLVVEAISVVGPAKKVEGGDSQDRVTKLRGGVPLDDWWVEFVIEYTVTPTIGFKVTDCHGGK